MAYVFDLGNPATNANPFPEFARLRAEDPVHWSPAMKAWIVTRYADVKQVALNNRQISADRLTPFFKANAEYQRGSIESLVRYLNHWMVFRDPPDHTRLRRLFTKAFNEQYGGIVEYRANSNVTEIDARSRTAITEVGERVRADVLNVIPPQGAGEDRVVVGPRPDAGKGVDASREGVRGPPRDQVARGVGDVRAEHRPEHAHQGGDHLRVGEGLGPASERAAEEGHEHGGGHEARGVEGRWKLPVALRRVPEELRPLRPEHARETQDHPVDEAEAHVLDRA